jgi:hypothetical protein
MNNDPLSRLVRQVAGAEPRPPLLCIGCNKVPDQLGEYSPRATGIDLTPDEYVWQEEGTLNPNNGHFLCDSCYIAAGMPTSPFGWTAP